MSKFTITKITTNLDDTGYWTELQCNDDKEWWHIVGPPSDGIDNSVLAALAVFTGDSDAWNKYGYAVKPPVRIESMTVRHYYREVGNEWQVVADCRDRNDEWTLEASAPSAVEAVSLVHTYFEEGPGEWGDHGRCVCKGN